MLEPDEELEPLFDYRRVQPLSIISLDDDSPKRLTSKRRKVSACAVEKVDKISTVGVVVDCDKEKDDKEDDWLLPPKVTSNAHKKLNENSTIKELRLKKQELLSFAHTAKNVLQALEASAKRNVDASMESSVETFAHNPSNLPCGRVKIVISIQDKDGLKQFRVYTDDKFKRLFQMYADKVKLDVRHLVFSFDGDKIDPDVTPSGLEMEDDDIIEVNVKSI